MEPKAPEVRNLALLVGSVVLAAGLSARMGRPKLLLKVDTPEDYQRLVALLEREGDGIPS